MTNEEVLEYFYDKVELSLEKNNLVSVPYEFTEIKGELTFDLINAKDGKKMLGKGENLTNRHNRDFVEKGLSKILVPKEHIFGKFLAEDIFNTETGEVYAEAGDEIDEVKVEFLEQANVRKFNVIVINDDVGPYIRNTLQVESNITRAEALAAIYKIMRPGEPPTEESSEKLFYDLFFSRLEGKKDTLQFYNEPKKNVDEILKLSNDIIEQEGVWILKQEGDWSLVTLGVLARKGLDANLWV